MKALVLAVLPLLAPAAWGQKASGSGLEEAQKQAAALADAAKNLNAPAAVERRRSYQWVRFPTWEIAAVRESGALASDGVRLSTQDVADAQFVFGDALILDRVRIVFEQVSLLGTPQTWGNTIRIPVGSGVNRSGLIHELTHVWQYQTGGTAYISDSFLHNAASVLTTGDRDKAYDYTVVEGKAFLDYTAEQQAKIVEDYFATKRTAPLYMELIAQMRRRKALRLADDDFRIEQAAGLAPRDRSPQPLPGWEPPREGAGVPQLEFRFKTPW